MKLLKIVVGLIRADPGDIVFDGAAAANSIAQPFHPFRQLLRCSLRISSRRVQRFVPKNLSESDQIVASFIKVLVGHRVAKQMRVELDSRDRRILVAQRPHSTNPSKRLASRCSSRSTLGRSRDRLRAIELG